MSDLPEQDANVKPKQYLLMVDETLMMFLSKLIPSMLFVEVEGLAMKDNTEHTLLVNPVQKPKAKEPVVQD